jgi:hypothetical protein
MSYTIKTITQYAVVSNDNGQPIAVCKDRSEATAIVNMMAGHGKPVAKPYTFSDWARGL